jgi:hypothetical protein
MFLRREDTASLLQARRRRRVRDGELNFSAPAQAQYLVRGAVSIDAGSASIDAV